MNIRYVSYNEVIRTHDIIIDKSGGLKGINNSGLIISVLEHIQNDLYYPSFVDKITHLLYSFVMNHAFNDGNKRTSIACCLLMLYRNNFRAKIDEFVYKMEIVVVLIAEKKIDKETLKEIISDILE